MRTISFKEISAGVSGLMGWDPDNLDSLQFAAIRRAVSQALGDIWERYWWSDLSRVAERTFRPPYNAAATYAAGAFVWFAGSRRYYQALQETVGNAPATLSGSTWTENSQYWAEAQAQPSAGAWISTTAYAVGDQVTWLENNLVYQCITAGTGNLPSGSAWAEIVPFDAYVDLLEPGVVPIGRVRAVWDRNPRVYAGARRLEWAKSHRGIEVFTENVTVWVEGLLRPHWFTGDNYDAAAAYTAADASDVSGDTITPEDTLTTDTSGIGYAGIVALRARVTHSDNQLAYLLYVATEGDGGGGWFRFVATSTEADDGVDVLRPADIISSNPGRWRRVS
jgi:hypothetical protein